jgi:hypothetical protein
MSTGEPDAITPSPLRRHAADALRRARKLPVGRARNDLRQLAIGLLWLDRRGSSETIWQVTAAFRELEGDELKPQE